MAAKYVQHVSGQGERWEVYYEHECYPHLWFCKDHQEYEHKPFAPVLWLPKSEYRLCDPPEKWVDVTHECQVINGVLYHAGTRIYWMNGYRPRMVQLYKPPQLAPGCIPAEGQWAFIVEKKES